MKCKVIHFLLYIQNFIIDFIRNILFTSYDHPDECSKILILRTGSLGDGVCAMPALSIIRKSFPNTNIDIITNASSKNSKTSLGYLLDSNLYNVIYYENVKDFYDIIQKNNYDLYIELTQNYDSLYTQLRNMFFIRFTGIPHAFGWCIQNIKSLSKWQEECQLISSETNRLNQVLADEGLIINSADISYDFEIGPSDNDVVNNMLHNLNLDGDKKIITFVVGAKRAMNIWPIEHFMKVAEYLILRGYKILLVGGKGDEDNASQIIKLKGAFNVIGKTSPIQTGLIMSRTNLVISNDTGSMHLAYAFGTPVVAIFSGRDCGTKWYPPNKSDKVFKAENIHCSYCFSETCTNNICMKKIKPESVITYLKDEGF